MRKLQKAWIVLGEQRWLFDEESWTLNDWFLIKNTTGFSRLPFLQGVLEEDPQAMQVLVWFLRRRNEPDLALSAVQFNPAAVEAEEFEQEDDADPPSEGAATKPLTLPPTSAPDATSTSMPSGDASASPPVMSIP
jgi:hypothetical protein